MLLENNELKLPELKEEYNLEKLIEVVEMSIDDFINTIKLKRRNSICTSRDQFFMELSQFSHTKSLKLKGLGGKEVNNGMDIWRLRTSNATNIKETESDRASNHNSSPKSVNTAQRLAKSMR